MLAGTPVAIVPSGYRTRDDAPIRTIGVGYDGGDESRAAVDAAVAVARAVGARLRLIRVFDANLYGSPALASGPGYFPALESIEQQAREQLEQLVAPAAKASA